MDNIFIDENVFNIGSLKNAKVYIPGPGYEYDVVLHNETLFLRRMKDTKKNINRVDISEFSKNKNCVISLIQTVNDYKDIDWAQTTDYVNIEKVKKWSTKYSLPRSLDRIRSELIDGLICVNLNLVCFEIVTLRLLYDLWSALINENIDKLIRLYFQFINHPWIKADYSKPEYKINPQYIDRNIDVKYFEFMNYNNTKNMIIQNMENKKFHKFYCCGIFAAIFDSALHHSCFYKISSPLVETKNMDSLFLTIDTFCDIIDLCYFQLFSIINIKDGARHVKTCANCGDIFWATHGRRKYCGKPECDRRTVFRKRKEAEKTE